MIATNLSPDGNDKNAKRDDIIESLKTANIIGRGGAEFPAHLKWTAVKEAKAATKYVICNVSEREPGVFKDYHILANEPEKVFAGMILAMQTVGAKEGIFNLNVTYEKKFKKMLDARIAQAKTNGFPMRIYEELSSYIGGEETALLNAIEKKRVEPRLKPPFPTEKGLFNCPTLIHNVETFYDIALVADGTYDGKRFYSVSGATRNTGVYRLPVDLTTMQILEQTKNVPKEPFFAQVGGGASGRVLNVDQLKMEKPGGTGAIVVHLLAESPRGLLMEWLSFFQRESCGKCAPCREGTYQLLRLLEDNTDIPWDAMQPLLDALTETSFCGLGRAVPVPVQTYYRNVLSR